jgi:Cys-tRNA(Pro) deacylase
VSYSFPSTRAVHLLRKHGIEFQAHLYRYAGLGNVAKDAAAALGIGELEVFKTLVFVAGSRPFLVLVDARYRVQLRELSKTVGESDIAECSPRDAERYTGYKVGAISPFGSRRPMPICLDSAALCLDRIYVSGGSHGFMISLSVADLLIVLDPRIGSFGYV